MSPLPADLVRRGRVLLALLLVGGGIVAVRLFDLQVVQAEELRRLARRQQERDVVLEPGRGAILDRHGRALALSIDAPSVYADPSEVRDPAAAAAELAPVLGVPASRIEELLRRRSYFVWLKRKVEPATRSAVEALRLRGIGTVPEPKRVYPHGELFAHLLGGVGLDDQGLAGLEARFDTDVRGTPGRFRTLRDARGESPLPGGAAPAEAAGGRTLVLTVDEAIQHVTDRALRRAVAAHGARGGAALTLNPATGEILSISSLPTFDPNTFPSSPPSTWRNRALEETLEPGSTLKIVTAAAALEAGAFRPEDRIPCGNGAVPIAKTVIRDMHPWGDLSFAEVVQNSSNVGAVRIGQRVGCERLHATLRAFGFGEPTGIDLPGEAAGILHPARAWSELSLASVSIGHEVGVTPLQTAVALAAVANGGDVLAPFVVSEVREPDGRLVRARGRGVRRRAVRESTARELAAILEGVVTSGTGKRAAVPGYAVAGKTGTAQKIGPSGGYEEGRTVASFAGFLPADAPALVAVVVVDEPRAGAVTGGEVAAPVFAEIAAESMRILRVPPRGGVEGAPSPALRAGGAAAPPALPAAVARL